MIHGYKINQIKSNVYIDENVLGYVITLPLISRGTLKAYRMIPITIPISLGNSKIVYISTEESNLCIDQTRKYYFGMSDTEFYSWKNVDGQTRICKQNHPLLSSHLQETCAVKLMQHRMEFPKKL
jgi:hypothetical protein